MIFCANLYYIIEFWWIFISKFIFLNNEPCTIRPTSIDLNADELLQALRHYAFIVSLDTCIGKSWFICSSICVPSKTGDIHETVFNMVTGFNESNKNSIQYNIFYVIVNKNLMVKKKEKEKNKNNDKCWCECKKSIKQHACKDFLWNPSQCDCERDKNM